MHNPMAHHGISRRGFAGSALAAAASAVLPATGQAATEEPPKTDLPPASAAEAEAAYAAILRAHGTRLSQQQKTDVHRLVVQNQKAFDTLRGFALDNADEPATILNPNYPEKR
jgi:hypothetical protein